MDRELILTGVFLSTLLFAQTASAAIIGLLRSNPGNNVTVKYVNPGSPALEVNVPQAFDCPIRFYRHSPSEYQNDEDSKELQKAESHLTYGLWQDLDCLKQLPEDSKSGNRTYTLDLKKEIFDHPLMREYFSKFVDGKLRIDFVVQVPATVGYEMEIARTGEVRLGSTVPGTVLFDRRYVPLQTIITDLGLTDLKKMSGAVAIGDSPVPEGTLVFKHPSFVGQSQAITLAVSKATRKWSDDQSTWYSFAMHKGEIVDRNTQAELARQRKTFCNLTVVVPRADAIRTEISVAPRTFEKISDDGYGCAFCDDAARIDYPDLQNKRLRTSMVSTRPFRNANDPTDIDGLSCTHRREQKLTYGMLSEHLRVGGEPIINVMTDYPPYQEGFAGNPLPKSAK